MPLPLKLNDRYFFLTVLLFGIEVLIAVFAHDRIIRPYIGDVLVVMLIYCFVKSFADTPYFVTAIAVLLFSYIIEISQYFNIVDVLGLQNSAVARTVMGTSFAWMDLIAYTAGAAIIIFVEMVIAKKR